MTWNDEVVFQLGILPQDLAHASDDVRANMMRQDADPDESVPCDHRQI